MHASDHASVTPIYPERGCKNSITTVQTVSTAL